MSDVASAAGVSRQTLYKEFGSRDEFAQAFVIHVGQRFLDDVDAAVREHLDGEEGVREYVAQVTAFLDTWMPRFDADSRSYVTIAFGCTGGRHRSVYLAEKLAQHFREAGREDVLTYHRELE